MDVVRLGDVRRIWQQCKADRVDTGNGKSVFSRTRLLKALWPDPDDSITTKGKVNLDSLMGNGLAAEFWGLNQKPQRAAVL